MDIMHIKDKQTGEVFKITPVANTVYVDTRDGVRVKLHPVTIKMMVPRGKDLDGQTITGPRPMIRL